MMKANRKLIIDFFRRQFLCSKHAAEIAFNEFAILLMTKTVEDTKYTLRDLLFLIQKAYHGRSKNTYRSFREWPPPLQRMFAPFYAELVSGHKEIIKLKLGVNGERTVFIKDINTALGVDNHMYHEAFRNIANKIRYAKEQDGSI